MISILLLLSLAAPPALAGAPEDLLLAADKSLDESSRMAAFDRLVLLGNTNLKEVLRVSADPSADARARWVAVRVLGQVKGDMARQALLERLNDDMPAMRVAAANALGDVGDPIAVDPLVKCLADPAQLVRAAAADALGNIGDGRAVPALSAAVTAKDGYHRGESLWVRSHYVDALGRIGSKSAIPALLSALDDPDPSVSGAAVKAFEAVSGFSYAEGRSTEEERAAWRRWAGAQIK